MDEPRRKSDLPTPEAPSEDDFRKLYEGLLESEARFRTMADSAPVLLWMSGTDSLCTFFNQQWLVFTGRSMEMEIGTGWAEGVHPEDFQRCMETYMDAFVARRAFRMEYRLRRADGRYRWLLDQGKPRHAPGGAFAGYIGSCVDITELREASEAQREITKQLEVLVKEIHHRVKNNLQVISSLINLQIRQVDEPRVATMLGETRDRIRSIALVHERLYQAHDLTSIQVDGYVTSILTSLRSALDGSRPAVEIAVDAGGLSLPIDDAIPCGLIVNELVTNALKYAFASGERPPRVAVSFSRIAPGRLRMVVADSGCGIPDGVDTTRPRTLGLQLVRTLARQIEADVTVSTDDGTRWTLTFPDSTAGTTQEGEHHATS